MAVEQKSKYKGRYKNRFEFVLSGNDNLICLRYFPVKDYNEDVINSPELVECLDRITWMVENSLKEKTSGYLHNYYNPFFEQSTEKSKPENINEEENYFDVVIKVDKRPVAIKRINGNVFPYKVRSYVDIRSLIPEIITVIRETLELDEVTTEIQGYKLV